MDADTELVNIMDISYGFGQPNKSKTSIEIEFQPILLTYGFGGKYTHLTFSF